MNTKKQIYEDIFFDITFALTTMLTFAQSTSEIPHQNISTDSAVAYRLFATRNVYDFIKLNPDYAVEISIAKSIG